VKEVIVDCVLSPEHRRANKPDFFVIAFFFRDKLLFVAAIFRLFRLKVVEVVVD